MTKLTTCLWFDHGVAEQAAAFYASVFDDCVITGTDHYPEDAPGPAGGVLSVTWRIGDQEFMGLNGGPEFPHSEAISFQIPCADQAEVDRYWDALLADGGTPSQCGWLKDRFGVSWQVVSTRIIDLISDPDPQRRYRAFQAMMRQSKPVIAEIEDAAATVDA